MSKEKNNDTPCLNNFTAESYKNAVLTEAQIDRCTGCGDFKYDCSSGIAGCKKFE